MGLNSNWPHSVDILLIDDTGTGARMGRDQVKLLVTAGVRCLVTNASLIRRSARADIHSGAFGREETRCYYLVQFPDYPALTVGNLLAWVRPEDGVLVYLQVSGLLRSPDDGKWLPWVAYCELDLSAEPPLTSTVGLSVYVPPS